MLTKLVPSAVDANPSTNKHFQCIEIQVPLAQYKIEILVLVRLMQKSNA